MIEIKITTDYALQLLLERMRFELKKRNQLEKYLANYQLEELSYKELKSIVDTSVFDMVFLLPLDLILAESNLITIIGSTIRALSNVFHHEEFLLFSDKKAGQLINPLLQTLKSQVEKEEYSQN